MSADGVEAERTLGWAQLLPIDHPSPVPLSAEAEAWLAAQNDAVAPVLAAWVGFLGRHGVDVDETRHLDTAIATRTARLAAQLHATAPDWLGWWLGSRPGDPAGAVVWDDTVTRIAAWRDHHHLDPTTPGLGPPPEQAPTLPASRGGGRR